MSDVDALLAAVLADPAADLPRLVYADWLDDRGTPGDAERAALIRVQIEQAAVPRHPRYWALAVWAAGLLGTHPARPQWLGDDALLGRGYVRRFASAAAGGGGAWLNAPGPDGTARFLFRRGFVARAELVPPTFAAAAARLFRLQPVERVVLTGKNPYSAGRAEPPWWWDEGPGVPGETTLPEELFSLLPPAPHRRGRSVGYDTEAAAREALAVAGLAFGRAAAGR